MTNDVPFVEPEEVYMQPNPFAALAHSRKFWLTMLDAIGSSVLLLATRYLSPTDLDFVKQLVAIYQPVFIALIVGITVEDGAAKLAQRERY